MPRDVESVIDILLAVELIDQFLSGVDFDMFIGNPEKQSAVLHQIMIIGEATKRISPDFRTLHSNVPWKRMAGMRDRLIHVYDRVEFATHVGGRYRGSASDRQISAHYLAEAGSLNH